jgi:hypothetical protein
MVVVTAAVGTGIALTIEWGNSGSDTYWIRKILGFGYLAVPCCNEKLLYNIYRIRNNENAGFQIGGTVYFVGVV